MSNKYVECIRKNKSFKSINYKSINICGDSTLQAEYIQFNIEYRNIALCKESNTNEHLNHLKLVYNLPPKLYKDQEN